MTSMDKLLAIMASLRDPDQGCPWDREQSFSSLLPHTLEEAYEVAELIEQGKFDKLANELGDLLFQIVFYAQIAKEQQLFTFEDVVTEITEKMLRRHPHVFGDETISDSQEQTKQWEKLKQQERSDQSSQSQLDGLNYHLPAVSFANKLQKRAALTGFDWANMQDVFAKVEEELQETVEAWQAQDEAALTEEIGDLMFVCVNVARYAKIDPETALRKANRKFEKRFRYMETVIKEEHGSMDALSVEQMEAYWNQAKKYTS